MSNKATNLHYFLAQVCILLLAQREGFEPPETLISTVFKTAVIDHSTISAYLFFPKRYRLLDYYTRLKKNCQRFSRVFPLLLYFFLFSCYNIPMNTSTLQKNLLEFASSLGADIVGCCVLPQPPVKDLPELTYAISIGVKLSDGVLKTIDSAPSFAYFQHYRTANSLLDQIAFRVAREIEKQGYQALPIAASQSLGKDNPYRGIFPHKTAAVLSGLGFVGKSGLFLSKDYGGKVRLATILTSLPLEAEHPVIENGCGECTICQKACPAGAIFGELPKTNGERNFDPEKCSKYMKEHFQDIGRGSVCGICIKVCPKNKL